jgi:hypothetical protein
MMFSSLLFPSVPIFSTDSQAYRRDPRTGGSAFSISANIQCQSRCITDYCQQKCLETIQKRIFTEKAELVVPIGFSNNVTYDVYLSFYTFGVLSTGR